MLTFGSLFSGIGGFDLGFERAGMQCVWQCEIDEKAGAVLSNHWPDVTRYKDVREIGANNLKPVDLICGGFPCQDLSVAGKRKGLAGERSGLWFEFHRILSELTPRWVVIENVPGLLSSANGRDFAVILHGLGELGYLSAWRILDAQYFGVAQRRRRVFIVASFGNGRAAEVLFERESLPGDTPPRRAKGQGATRSIAPSITGSYGKQPDNSDTGLGPMLIANPIAAHHSRQDLDNDTWIPTVSPSLSSEGADSSEDGRGRHALIAFNADRDGLSSSEDVCPTLTHIGNEKTGHGAYPKMSVAFQQNTRDEVRLMNGDGSIAGALAAEAGMKQQNYIAFGGNNTSGPIDIATSCLAHKSTFRGDFESETFVATPLTVKPYGDNESQESKLVCAFTERTRTDGRNLETSEEIAYALTNPGSGGRTHSRQIAGGFGVRRLTPVECERLQGFPDGWTNNQSDSSRYRQLGNAVCVNVAHWIGQRIMEV